ncbi:hypothetical protein HDU96_004916, partial [Phlyctochytrium bullatum]
FPPEPQAAVCPVSVALQASVGIDGDGMRYVLAPSTINQPWRLHVRVLAPDRLPSFPSVYPRSTDQRVRYWEALQELTHDEQYLSRQVLMLGTTSPNGQRRSLSFGQFSDLERHLLVAPGRFAEYAALAGLRDDRNRPSPGPAVVAANLTPSPTPAQEAVAPTSSQVDAITFVDFPDLVDVSSLHEHTIVPPAAEESNPAEAFEIAAVDNQEVTAVHAAPVDLHLDAVAVTTPSIMTPPTAAPVPIAPTTARSRVRLTTPVPLSPRVGSTHPRTTSSVAAPPTFGGGSFYTPAAGLSPHQAPHMVTSPVPFGGWTNTWSQPPPAAAAPTPVISPVPRRASPPVVFPDAWRPPVVTSIPASDARHYAERIAALDRREASLAALEQRLLALAEQYDQDR